MARLFVSCLLCTFQFHTGSIKSLSLGSGATRDAGQFQFHTGSIKRRSPKKTTSTLIWFQFHTGSIKRLKELFCLSKSMMFQFHTGSIKRAGSSAKQMQGIGFNSILVRLKVLCEFL